MKKPRRAKLYPEPGFGSHVKVVVWPTKKAMLEHGAKLRGDCVTTRTGNLPRETQAFCWQTPGRRLCFSEVHFWKKSFIPSVIAHELLHATLIFARRTRFDFSRLDELSAYEEKLTSVIQYMVEQLETVLG